MAPAARALTGSSAHPASAIAAIPIRTTTALFMTALPTTAVDCRDHERQAFSYLNDILRQKATKDAA
jgi:hypothetical protein